MPPLSFGEDAKSTSCPWPGEQDFGRDKSAVVNVISLYSTICHDISSTVSVGTIPKINWQNFHVGSPPKADWANRSLGFWRDPTCRSSWCYPIINDQIVWDFLVA